MKIRFFIALLSICLANVACERVLNGPVVEKEIVPEHTDKVLSPDIYTTFSGETSVRLEWVDVTKPTQYYLTVRCKDSKGKLIDVTRNVEKSVYEAYKVGDQFPKLEK